MSAKSQASSIYVACIPHVPILSLQEDKKDASAGFWKAYDERVAEFDAFDPDLVIIFGGDHYSNVHLKLMPAFMIAHSAEGIDDCGGLEGKLNVPMDLSLELADHLIDEGFDIATSYALKVDHGFTNPMTFFLHHKIDGRPVLPIYINCIADPRPTLKRCREFGDAIGKWAARLGKKVAILGTGGLSHETGAYFPQYKSAPNEEVRDFIVHGGMEGGITHRSWHDRITDAMHMGSQKMIEGFRGSSLNAEWDLKFLNTLSDDPKALDGWTQKDILQGGGNGASEVRLWVAAVAAGQAAGAGKAVTDYYSHDTTIGVGAGVAHIPAYVPARETEAA